MFATGKLFVNARYSMIYIFILAVTAPFTFGDLVVTPTDAWETSGEPGGPFAPASQEYQLSNTGAAGFNWGVTETTDWLEVDVTFGHLDPAQSTSVNVNLTAAAQTLLPGIYEATVTFINITAGTQYNRQVVLTVNGQVLEVTPAEDFEPAGEPGGPFAPSSKTYTIRNIGGSSLYWGLSKTAAWLQLSPTFGQLTPGSSAQTTVSLKSDANLLEDGVYTDTLTFTNLSNHEAHTRQVTLTIITVPPQTYHVDKASGSDSNDGLSRDSAFATIQKAFTVAGDGDTILVWPGVYTGPVDFLGKAVTLQSAADAAVLTKSGGNALVFDQGEGAGSVVRNLVIRGSSRGIYIANSSPTIENVTVVNNTYGIYAEGTSDPAIRNSIFWNNVNGDLIGCTAGFSCYEGGDPSQGNISTYPLFANPAGNDFHLLSERGRFISTPQGWSDPARIEEIYDPAHDKYCQDPCLSRDGLTLYFTRYMSEAGNFLASVHRDYPEGPFGSEVVFHELDHGTQLRGPWISADELRLYYEDSIGSDVVIKMAERVSKNDPWVVKFTFSGIHVNGYSDNHPSLTADELTMYWHSNRPGAFGQSAIWKATRNSIAEPFANPVNVSELNSNFAEGISVNSCIMPDGLTIYFGGRRDGAAIGGFYRATRAALNEPFSNITGSIFSGSVEGDYKHYVTPDEKSIYCQIDSYTNGIWFSQYHNGQWLMDDLTSPCIDVGDPTVNPMAEPMPNGARINMGAYGNTASASRSEWPIKGDVNHDGVYDLGDFALLVQDWLWTAEWVE